MHTHLPHLGRKCLKPLRWLVRHALRAWSPEGETLKASGDEDPLKDTQTQLARQGGETLDRPDYDSRTPGAGPLGRILQNPEQRPQFVSGAPAACLWARAPHTIAVSGF